jgi:hypothetical protein
MFNRSPAGPDRPWKTLLRLAIVSGVPSEKLAQLSEAAETSLGARAYQTMRKELEWVQPASGSQQQDTPAKP